MKKCVATIVLGLFMSYGAPAVGGEYDAFVPDFPVEVMSVGGIEYVSGGFGAEERESIRKAAWHYKLKLVFAKTGGDYLSDVAVAITGGHGNPLFEAVSSGPWLLVDLPPGTYNVSCRYDGRPLRQSVTVTGEKQTTRTFHWK